MVRQCAGQNRNLCHNVASMEPQLSQFTRRGRRPRLFAWMGLWTALSAGVQLGLGQLVDATAVTAEIRARQPVVVVGNPVWIDFALHNPTDQLSVLYLSGARGLELNVPEMGLPLEHVFDRGSSKAVVVMNAEGSEIAYGQSDEHPAKSVAVRLAPHATVGIRVDLSQHCPTLRKPGKYKLQWRPYQSALQSNILDIQVVALKQARIETDYGAMNIRLFYEDAPRHVENFLELAEQGFYDNLTFHRIVSGYLLQGGSPDEKPDGIRPDGKLLEPEFSDRQFVKGTVAMARRRSDPASASCQFFICGTRRSEWDETYTAFGELVGTESFETLDKLMALRVDKKDRPLKKVYIRAVRTMDAVESD